MHGYFSRGIFETILF